MTLTNFFEPEKNLLSETTHRLKDSTGIVAVDFSQIVISTIMATYKPTDDLDIAMIRHCILNTIRSNVMKFKAKYPDVIICVDNPTGGYWRKKEAFYYKFKRASGRDSSGWDWNVIFEAMKIVNQELVDLFPLIVIDIPGLEADDVIAVIAKTYSVAVPVLIVSSDGDFTQLHNKRVKQWSPMQNKFVKFKNGSAQRDLWAKVIGGDAKDSIANFRTRSDHFALEPDEVTGKNPRQTSIKKATLAELIDSDVNDLESVRAKVTDEEFKRIQENLKLLDLNNLPQFVTDSVIETLNNYKKANGRRLYSYCIKNRLNKIRENIQDFF